MSAEVPGLTVAVRVITAYLGNNHVEPRAIGRLIREIQETIADLQAGIDPSELIPELARKPKRGKPTPAEIRASITDKALVSFEDGKPYCMLKRHLTQRNLSPQEYRVKWGLPWNYPMVAAHYTRKRAELAGQTKLGRHDRQTKAKAAAMAAATAPGPEGPNAKGSSVERKMLSEDAAS